MHSISCHFCTLHSIQLIFYYNHFRYKRTLLNQLMMTPSKRNIYSRYWPFVRWIHRSPVTPHKGQWRGALMFSFICAWIYGWVNNREAGDLRRHGAHYGVNVMYIQQIVKIAVWLKSWELHGTFGSFVNKSLDPSIAINGNPYCYSEVNWRTSPAASGVAMVPNSYQHNETEAKCQLLADIYLNPFPYITKQVL